MDSKKFPNKPEYRLEFQAYIASIVADIILTLITCGLYNIYIQYRQIQAVNAMLAFSKNDNPMFGEKKYSFLKWALFCAFTCGIYHLYHEYVMSRDIEKATGENQMGLVTLILLLMGFTPVADAIQQNEINKYFGGSRL